MRKILGSIIASGLGLWLATLMVPQVHVRLLPNSSVFTFHLTAVWQIYVILAIVLGLLHYFAKPLLNLITLPLRIITLGFFGIIVDAALIFIVSVIFPELVVPLWLPLVWATLIISLTNFLLSAIV